MNFVKKNLNLLLVCCSAFFGVLVFATMAGKAAKLVVGGHESASYTGYEMMKDHLLTEASGVTIAALVLLIVAIVVALACACAIMLNKLGQYVKFCACFGSVLFLVAGILYFCVATGDYADFTVCAGAVFSGIFALVAACGLATYSVKEFLKK